MAKIRQLSRRSVLRGLGATIALPWLDIMAEGLNAAQRAAADPPRLGFFYIPGTETCLRVGGRMRAEYLYVEPIDREQDAIGFRARGRINLDARTATASQRPTMRACGAGLRPTHPRNSGGRAGAASARVTPRCG